MPDLLSDITTAIRQLVDSSGHEFRYFKATDSIDKVSKPTLYITIDNITADGKGGFYTFELFISILVAFGNLRSDDRRLIGLYQVLWPMIMLIKDCRLQVTENGLTRRLETGPFNLKSVQKKFENETTIAYVINGSLKHQASKVTANDDLQELLAIGIEYFLKNNGAGDDVADASDVINVQEG